MPGETAKPLFVAYSTRKLRRDLRDRLRLQATLRNETVEDTLNRALDAGLDVLESTSGS